MQMHARAKGGRERQRAKAPLFWLRGQGSLSLGFQLRRALARARARRLTLPCGHQRARFDRERCRLGRLRSCVARATKRERAGERASVGSGFCATNVRPSSQELLRDSIAAGPLWRSIAPRSLCYRRQRAQSWQLGLGDSRRREREGCGGRRPAPRPPTARAHTNKTDQPPKRKPTKQPTTTTAS